MVVDSLFFQPHYVVTKTEFFSLKVKCKSFHHPNEKCQAAINEMKIICSSKDIFYGKDVQNIWHKEKYAWQSLVTTLDYQFPNLGSSIYEDNNSNDMHIRMKNPIICQAIEWSYDGTSFVCRHDDFGIRQYLIPEDNGTPLVPFKRFFRNESIISSKVHPYNSLYNEQGGFELILISSHDLPIQLYSLASEDKDFNPVFSYDVMNQENEKYETPFVMDFDDDIHFFSGSFRNKVSLYDINRRSPIWTSKLTRQGCGKAFHRSIVSCFDQSNDRHNKNRFMGNYKSEIYRIDSRSPQTSLVFPRLSNDTSTGTYQLWQSGNGHYLYVFKRNSSIIDVIDIRKPFSLANQLHIPLKIGRQKFKGTINPLHGLLIGNNHGDIIQWTNDFIEFGGIDPTSSTSACDYKPFNLLNTPLKSRINIITHSPSDPNLLSVSYSPDKFDEDDNDSKSAIIVLEL